MRNHPKKPSRAKRQTLRRAARRRPGLRTRIFRDGSAVILNPNGSIIGLIEARAPYRVRRR